MLLNVRQVLCQVQRKCIVNSWLLKFIMEGEESGTKDGKALNQKR